jgi:RNA polymerase sigma-70 factor (ECF subfamily)
MVHSSIEYYRKHNKMIQMVDIEDVALEPSVNPLATANLAAKDLMVLIQKLSPGYRIVFNLYAIEGYSHKEIAAIIGISEGASKSQLSRARTVLKEQIIKMEGKKYENAGL